MSFLRQYLLAVQSFTRLPVTGTLAQWAGSGPETARASAAHYPGVGWLVGFVACAVFALLATALGDTPFAPLAAAVGCIAAALMLTGGAHETGLARTADAMGVAAPAAPAPGIVRDPRIRGDGVLALALALLAKVSLLAVLAAQSPAAVLGALIAAHVLSRFWPLLLASTLPSLGDAGTTGVRPLSARLDPRGLGIAAAWSVLALAIAWLAEGVAFAVLALAAGGLALLWMRRLFARRLRGFTDDALGATQQACEIATYLGAAVGLRVG
ncbi:MAG: adenosylcobinamide-GDP ribazoletransferase [Ramlibacter sp.]|nr:adenosylcobinamide-GDP ribazoletransferase [Ramlibacter sp.]